jgi:hypothetical protein
VTDATQDPIDRSPFALRIAVWVLFAQAAVLALLTVILGYYAAFGDPPNRKASIGVAGYVLVMTVLLALVGTALVRRRRWARAPAIVFQLLQVMLGMTLVTSGQAVLGVPLLVPAVVGATLLFAPSTGAAVKGRSPA